LGFPTGWLSCPHQAVFLAPLPGKKKTSARGVSQAHPLLCFSFALLYFCLHCFYQKYKKISFLYSCFYLLAFSFVRMTNPEVEVRTFKQLIRPFCITILYHNLMLFIDIFHI
jgi:hypothetical protein